MLPPWTDINYGVATKLATRTDGLNAMVSRLQAASSADLNVGHILQRGMDDPLRRIRQENPYS